MKIGILQTGHVLEELVPRHGEYSSMFARMLRDKGFEFSVWNVVDSEFPKSVFDCDGWLITGSRHATYEPHDWIEPLETFIRGCFENSVKLVGVCFGHQIMAQALGGQVEKFSGGWSVGRMEYSLFGRSRFLNCWHQDQVVSVPPYASVVGDSETCKYAALTYGPNALSVQPHPEFGHEFISELIETRGVGVVPDCLLNEASRQLDMPLDNDLIASWFSGFFHDSDSAHISFPDHE